MPFSQKIDTHAHFIPPSYRAECLRTGHGKPDGMPAIPAWSEDAHLKLMAEMSITKSIISISSPGTYLVPDDDSLARKVTRECNEYAADLVKRRPDQFGFWASLPLPDVEGSLVELSYALETLHAEGFTLETNHHGIYLGDPRFDRVFQELNRRKATVFIHPTTPCSVHTSHVQSLAPLEQYPNPMMEFMFDTARAVINLFLSGTIERCPDITFVIPHAGGALPPIIERFASFGAYLPQAPKINSDIVKKTFARQFYFDLAGFVFPDQIWGLLRYVGWDRLLYGSDYPFTPPVVVGKLSMALEEGVKNDFEQESEREAALFNNASRLLKKLNQTETRTGSSLGSL